jgi:hypothetical protein
VRKRTLLPRFMSRVIEKVAIVALFYIPILLAVLILLKVLSFLPENLKEEYTLRGDLGYTTLILSSQCGHLREKTAHRLFGFLPLLGCIQLFPPPAASSMARGSINIVFYKN